MEEVALPWSHGRNELDVTRLAGCLKTPAVSILGRDSLVPAPGNRNVRDVVPTQLTPPQSSCTFRPSAGALRLDDFCLPFPIGS
jgi:hypothetical protein